MIVEAIRRLSALTTHRISSLPVLVLMPHSRCNCRCVMCDIWKANKVGQEISAETLERHLAELRRLNVRWVVLSGGEALMHSDLFRLCRLLKEIGVRITLLSTGLLLERHRDAILEWCDEVMVSLDGSREIHDRIRNIPRAYERLAAGIAALKAAAPSFPISARTVLQRQNFEDLPNIIDSALALGLDRVSFLTADVSSTAFNRAEPWTPERTDDVALSADEVTRFAQIVEATIVSHAAWFARGFISESPDKLRRLPRYYQAITGAGAFPEQRCNAPWVSAVIEADGAVRPCFFQPAYGSIDDGPLDAIVNSPRAIAFRRGLDVNRDPTCQRCVCTLNIAPLQRLASG